ncbi:MAG: hypothetical protein HYZ27_06760, partial [Deltaproteobacteria bacterium]|nr:hypothetical protein [Deltaproteobacteria bacterium]
MIALAVLMLLGGGNTNPWQEVRNKDGITVWARDVPGSPIREVRAEMVVEIPAERVWAVLVDVPSYLEFMPYLVEASVIGPAGANAQYEYQLIDPPIVDRRDYVLKVNFEEQDGYYRRSWRPANGVGPAPREDVVRLSICEGSWTVERREDGRTSVTYWLYTDPGGAIPNFIANKANTTSVPDLMAAVRRANVMANERSRLVEFSAKDGVLTLSG